ncbi:Heat shock protein 86 family protein [Balamuthia mandrillaris]
MPETKRRSQFITSLVPSLFFFLMTEAAQPSSQSPFLLLRANVKPQLNGATNLLQHFGLTTEWNSKDVPPTYEPYISHLPGDLDTDDPNTRLRPLFRQDEFPIVEEEDNAILPPLGAEAFKAFTLEEGPILEDKKKKEHRHKHKHRHKHRRKHKHREGEEDTNEEGAEHKRHRHKKKRHKDKEEGENGRKKKRRKKEKHREESPNSHNHHHPNDTSAANNNNGTHTLLSTK